MGLNKMVVLVDGKLKSWIKVMKHYGADGGGITSKLFQKKILNISNDIYFLYNKQELKQNHWILKNDRVIQYYNYFLYFRQVA